MKFKLHWGKAKVIERFHSPLAETDFEGNDLWARAFSKPKPLTDYERYIFQAFANSTDQMARHQAGMAQMRAMERATDPLRGLFGGLGGWL